MWWNVGPHLKRRMRAESGRTPDQSPQASGSGPSFFSSSSDLEEFKMVLRHKFGSIARAWRVGLDRDESGLLDFREFCAAMRAIGYVGNLRTLWFNMDADNSGALGTHFLWRESTDRPAHTFPGMPRAEDPLFGALRGCRS